MLSICSKFLPGSFPEYSSSLIFFATLKKHKAPILMATDVSLLVVFCLIVFFKTEGTDGF